MNCIKLFFLSLFLVSCSTNKSIIGLYGKCKKNEPCTQLYLKEDNTFEYQVFLSPKDIGTIVKGNWKKISKDSIVLNTFIQPEKPTTTYVGHINRNLSGVVNIKISDSYFPLSYTSLIVNENNVNTTDINGNAEFSTEKVYSIYFQYLGKEETIVIDNPNYNEIEITVNDLDITAMPRFFTDKVMYIKNNKLFYNKWFGLKRNQIKNKSWK